MKAAALVRLGLVLFALPRFASAEPAVLDQPRGLALDAAGHYLVTCRGSHSVVVMTRTGERVRQFGAERLQDPGGLAVLPSGQIAVANTGKNEVALFDPQGKFLRAANALAAPEDVAVGPDRLIYVADAGHARIAVFDERLQAMIRTIESSGDPPLKLSRPVGVAVAQDLLAVADAGNSRVVVMRLPRAPAEKVKATVIPIEGAAPCAVAIGTGLKIYVAAGGQVHGFTAQGQTAGTFAARVLRVTISNLFQPGALAVDSFGNILAVDQYTGRVLVTNAELGDPFPQVQVGRDGPATAVIEWTTPTPQPTVIEYGPTDDYGARLEEPALTTRHRAVLKNLNPATCYHYRIVRPLEMIPESAPARTGFSLAHQKKHLRQLAERSVSADETFASLPEAGKSDWASLPVIALVYRNVRFPASDGKRPPNRMLEDGDLSLMKSEMEKYRLWLWRHTACKLNLAFTYVLVDEERDHELLGSLTRPVLDDILRGVVSQGKDLHAFWNVLVVGTHGWYANYLDGMIAGSEYELGSCYAGFGHGQKAGWYWFPTHEHGHLIHSMAMNSGFSGFAFPDAPWTMPGQFGEDFSFMAANYRRQPPRMWLALRSASICQSTDANGNGVPDDDPRVPLDEKRFGWNAGQGGHCLTRLMAGVRSPGYPGGADTDFDGKVHALQEGELHWIDRIVPKGKIVLDGRIGDGEWKELYSVPNLTTPQEARSLKARLYAAWDEGHYYFAVKSDRPMIAGFDLDAANDGWFHGRDNLRFSVRPPMAGKPLEAAGAIWDFLDSRPNPHNGDLWFRDAYKPGEIRAAAGQQDGWHVIECAVPRRTDLGIAPAPDARFGLRAYLWSEAPGVLVPSVSFLDGESFVYDLRCSDAAARK